MPYSSANTQGQNNNDYFGNLINNIVSPMQELGQKTNASPLDYAGGIFDTAMNVLDVPSQMIGDGLDFAWDNTLGALTNTQDMFTGDDLKIIPEIASMAIPGLGGLKAAKTLKNLYNVSKFERAMAKPYENTTRNVVNSLNGLMADYGRDKGFHRVLRNKDRIAPGSHLTPVYEYEDWRGVQHYEPIKIGNELKWGKRYPLTVYDDPRDAASSLKRHSIESPVPLYRGGNDVDGWFYTPDRRIAKAYGKGKEGTRFGRRDDLSLFEQALGKILDTNKYNGVIKLPKGTKTAPGGYYKGKRGLTIGYGRGKNIDGREVFVTPKEAQSKSKGKYKPKNRNRR